MSNKQRDWQAIATRVMAEGPLTLAEASKLCPGQVASSTLWRWIVHGREGRYLDGVRAGRKWVTSQGALVRFFASLTEQAIPERIATVGESMTRADAARKRVQELLRRKSK